MLPSSSFAVLLGLLQVLHITADIDSGSFLIYNENHNKCVKVESATSITVAICNPNAKEQQFRWASEYRILSLKLKLCLGAAEIKDWIKVLLFQCNESNVLQHWQCKNETLFGLKDKDLHLNWGNRNERNLMIYKGSGLWSRWKVYGTKGDLCSKGFQEMFTVGGNALGTPCQFPFRFHNQWYAECTKDGRSDGRLWCATVRDYDTEQKWGFCPTEGTSGWDKDPVTGVQYQRNELSVLNWYQARKSCQQQGADLLSIVELHEQSYISGLMSSLGTVVWIGLNSLDSDSGWQWSNGNPYRYLNWVPGHPSSEPGLSCATINTGKASKWESSACSKKFGYICRRGSTNSLPTPPSRVQPTFCPSHWVPYAGNCYYLERNKKMIWKDALAACHKEGGDLASIHNIEEQSFMLSQSGYLPTDVLWIGFNDRKNQLLFEWSDNSQVTFTQWDVDEPSHATNLQEDCVQIRGKGFMQDAKWADHTCEKAYGYVCKKKASTRPSGGAQDQVSPGCKLGSTRFGSFCYDIGSEAKTFNEAKQACSGAGGYLVDVTNRYENALLVSLVGLRPEKYFWTGLSNTDDIHTFTWTTSRKVTFTNFNVGMPDRHQGCVAMTTGVFAGLWDVVSCGRKEKYICKKPAEGVHATTVPPTTLAPSCEAGWTPLPNRNFCFKIYNNREKEKRNWFEARDFCRAIGGDLLSIHSAKDLSRNEPRTSEPAWIGFHLVPGKGFAWSDGSPSGFENWGMGEPNNHNDAEHCTEVYAHYGRHWNDAYCASYKDWYCQIRKGVSPKPAPTQAPEVLNKTDDGWFISNDTQFFINTDKLDMESARAACKKKFGDLAVITGESERRFIWKLISKGFFREYYIGMFVNLDKSFSWVDGTPVTYTAWEKNEPNFANNDENCVTIYKSMGFWNDINCGLELPSICKRSSDFVNSTMAPTAIPTGGCAPEWVSFQGKCYKFVMGADKRNWQDARSYCVNQGGNLVSIRNFREQAFLTTQMLKYKESLWIGMNDVNWEMHFVWTDGKGVGFTNWATGHPVSVPKGRNTYNDEMFDCILIEGVIPRSTGSWKVEDCFSKKGFICKRNVDSQIAIPATTASTSAFYKLGNDSYKLLTQKMKWDEARRQCQADDGDLASVLDPVAHAFVTLQMHKHNESVWIGLNNIGTQGKFQWSDNWKLLFTQWAPDEPKKNYGCVYMDVDRKWKTSECSESRYSLCKKSPLVAPPEPPQLPGKCPEPKKGESWIPFRGHCYSFSSAKNNWAHASVDCLKLGGALVSMLDSQESIFIQHNIDLLKDSAPSFWIGLYKNHEGEWMWIDGSPVDYTNWNSEKHSSTCAELNSESGQWATNTCSRYRFYICKMAKVLEPTEKIPVVAHVVEEETQGGSAGVTVAVILVVIAVSVLGAFLFCRKRVPLPNSGESNFDNKLYFNNPLRVPVDAKGLVANIEQNEQIFES